MLEGPRHLLARIDLPGLQSFEQILDGEIEVDDLIGLFQKAVGDRFADLNSGIPGDQIVQALQMLNVERADHVDAGIQQLEDVLIALTMPAARHIGVCELVDDRDLRLASEHRVEVHLLDRDRPIIDTEPRHVLQAFDERRRFGASVRLDESEDYVDSARAQACASSSMR